MNSAISAFECVICYNEYDTKQRRPCIGQCGHSICESCKHQLTTAKCPQCNRDEAFSLTTINWQVLELMKTISRSSITSTEGPSRIPKIKNNLEEGTCSECGVASSRLRICVDCGIKDKILIQREKGVLSLNLEGTSVEEAVNRAKRTTLCGDCALENHNDHRTMKVAELKKDLDDIQHNSFETRINEMVKVTKTTIEDINTHFTHAYDKTNQLLEKSTTLGHADRKPHYSNIELSLHNMSIINDTMSDTMQRLQLTIDDLNKQLSHIELTGGVLLKKAIVFANSDPILIADRKQNVKDPLLIGVFTPRDKSWASVGRMPNPKSNYAVATYQTSIYIVGGMNNGSWLNSLEMYDKDKNLRRDCNPLKKGRTRTSAQFHNGKLFVCGGYDGTYMDSVEIFDPETKDWRDGPKLNRQRADCAIVTCAGELFILGGYNGKEYEEKIERLNEIEMKFEIVGEMGGSRAGFGACVFSGRIYIAGGWSNSNNTLKDCRSYDPIGGKWRDETAMSRDRKYFTLHATQEAVYAIRGCADNWNLIGEVERYDTKAKTWSTIPCVAQLSNANSTTSMTTGNTSANVSGASN